MTDSAPERGDHGGAGISRRTIVKSAGWSVPVMAVAVATPLAAASTGPAVLTYQVTPLVEVAAPYGSVSITVSNTSTMPYSGPITLTTPAWATVAPFLLAGTTSASAGENRVWTIPAATIPANESIVLNLTWDGAYPLTAEEQPLAVSVDAAAASISASGSTTVASPYESAWCAVTPGGEGNPAGTASFFIGNTTELPYIAGGTLRTEIWTSPLPPVPSMVADGTTYTGERVLERGEPIARYAGISLNVAARSGKLLFTFVPPAALPDTQESRRLLSFTADDSLTLDTLGDLTLYSPYAPGV